MTEEEKQKLEYLISRLEMTTGEILSRDNRLHDPVTRMLEHLAALRSALGLVKRRAGTPS